MMTPVLDFELPPGLEASVPPEEQGMLRDQVRLMVGHRVGVDELHREHMHRVRLVPGHLDEEADAERRRLRAGLRPATADDGELAVRDDRVVGEQHRGFH